MYQQDLAEWGFQTHRGITSAAAQPSDVTLYTLKAHYAVLAVDMQNRLPPTVKTLGY